MSQGTTYYQPYDSGEDTDATDATDESEVSDTEDIRIRREEDPRYAILRTPGPNLNTSQAQLKYMEHAPGAPWDASTNISSLKDYVYLQPPKTTKTSLVSIKSINRDRRIYPTPFNFQLKLPRVYKNITKFQLVQLSFPNNSGNVKQFDLYASTVVQLLLDQGIPSTCISTCVSIMNCTTSDNSFGMMEQGRTTADGTPLLTTLSIPNGSYDNSQLAQELTFQANNTPPLNLLSYSTFHEIFTNTRDASVLFNEPGDNFQSRTSNVRYGVHTKEQIMNTYYTQQHIDLLPEITDKNAINAYYYPILKEAIATKLAEPFIKTNGLPFNEVTNTVMGPFQGLNSDLYYTLCSTNQSVLDSYRRHLTFEFKNINQLKWSYNAKESRFITIHDNLHTSIQRDITKKYTSALNQELALCGLNANSFKSLKTAQVNHSCIYKHLERNLSTVFGNYHLASGFNYTGDSTYTTAESTFHVDDLAADENFTTMFNYTSTIGRIYGNYTGIPMTFTNFMEYHSTLSSYYTLVQSTATAVSSVYGNTNNDYHSYVSTKYSNVLPSGMIANQSYTSNQAVPVSFVTNQHLYVPGAMSALSQTSPENIQGGLYPTLDLNTVVLDTGTSATATSVTATPTSVAAATTSSNCQTICCAALSKLVNAWYSNIPVNTIIGTLQYRLGLMNLTPNTFNIFSTIANITSTGNMNFLMSINDEQGFNNMDITMPENYTISNETTGQVKLIAAKILMGNVGDTGISQTLIQNPSIFENTLGKLDKVSIKIYYDDNAITPAWQYLPFTLSLSEWNATFQIDEQVGFINQNAAWKNTPSVAIPTNPNQTPFLDFVKKDAPNNK